MSKYPSLDTDDMIKIQNDAMLDRPCSVPGEDAQNYYQHCQEFHKEVEAKGGVVQLPNSME